MTNRKNIMADHIDAWGDWFRKQSTTPEGLIRVMLIGIIAGVGWAWWQDSQQDRDLKQAYFSSQINATAELTAATRQLMDSAMNREVFQATVSKEHAETDIKVQENGRRVDELSRTTLQLVDQMDNTNKLLAVVITLLESSAKNAQGVATPGET